MKRFPYFILLLIGLLLTASSCGSNENNDNHIYNGLARLITIIPDRFNVVLQEDTEQQESITFTVSNNSGQNITSLSKIYVNNVLLEGNTFTPTALGSYTVVAKYIDEESEEEFLSDEKTINVIEDTSNLYFKHKVLIEDFTGTWCGWCTRIIYAIDQVLAQTHNVVPVAIHNDDPFEFSGRMPLENYLQVEGAYPFATLNRKTIWKHPQHHFINQPISLIQPQSPVGIKINSTLEANSGTVDVSFSFKENISGNLKYVVYVVENDLKADQANYNTDLYDGVSVLYNFNHNHVLRGVYNDILGNTLSTDVTAGSEFSFEGLSINYTAENINKLQVVVFVINEQGKALNVQIANGNSLKDYEYAH